MQDRGQAFMAPRPKIKQQHGTKDGPGAELPPPPLPPPPPAPPACSDPAAEMHVVQGKAGHQQGHAVFIGVLFDAQAEPRHGAQMMSGSQF